MKNGCYIVSLLAMMALGVSSCKEKQQTEDIIVDKVVAKPQSGPERMAESENNGSVTWVGGAHYTYTAKRTTSDSLAVVENHGKKYHDNKVHLAVYRADGTVFFQKTFTKENFAPVLPAQFKDHGVLLGMNLDKAEGNQLHFVVSVGSPDENNEEFYYVGMTLDNFGNTSAEKYQVPAEEE